MSSYAPLLVNTNDVDWPVNLINFDDAKSFARISYYAIKMFNANKPTVNLATDVKIIQSEIKQPQFSGGIGLATWDTKVEYKDIEIIQNGKEVFKSDFINDLDSWEMLRGKWEVQDSALAQIANGAQQFAMLRDKRFDTYTLKLKAKKLSGYNAFIIPFAVKDSNTFYRAHIGGYVNRVSMFEKVTNGYDVNNMSATVNLPDTIAANRWYDIELQVGLDTVKCFLDGKLLMTYTEPDKLFAISGKDEKNGDIILKIVNAYNAEIPVNVGFQNSFPIQPSSELITLSAPNLTDENSFEQPEQYIPKRRYVETTGKSLSLTLKRHSINTIRLKPKK
jgi:alpha-N-arabinofuranosidase